jgi:multidrug efflux pump subunit AcrB
MVLGGLALAVGRLVDDAIVVLENTDRHLALGTPPVQAALDGAAEVAMPVMVATITTIVVFFPVVFLNGIGKFLFTPLALAVSFAIAASYLVAMTVIPVCSARPFPGTRLIGREAAAVNLVDSGPAAEASSAGGASTATRGTPTSYATRSHTCGWCWARRGSSS